MRRSTFCCALSAGLFACGSPPPAVTTPTAARDAGTVDAWTEPRAFALPGASAPAFVDYLAYEPKAERIWVPVGNTGSVDVLDVASGTFTRVDGFTTAERLARGTTRRVGPAAATVGDGFVYIGNRATNEICPVDAKTLTLGTCLALTQPTDGVAYVASVKEIWVTMGDQSLTVIDASKPDALRVKTSVKVAGDPEGYAVDEVRGLFFTNLEDQDATLAIDVRTHQVTATWKPGCGAEGPRGLAVDPSTKLVFVACTDHIQVLDGGHDGARLGTLETGKGVDNIDYLPSKKWLYVASGGAARLTIAKVDDRGQLTVLGSSATASGARNVVTDTAGNAFVADPRGARLLQVSRSTARPPSR